jgi:hypothetical protein
MLNLYGLFGFKIQYIEILIFLHVQLSEYTLND